MSVCGWGGWSEQGVGRLADPVGTLSRAGRRPCDAPGPPRAASERPGRTQVNCRGAPHHASNPRSGRVRPGDRLQADPAAPDTTIIQLERLSRRQRIGPPRRLRSARPRPSPGRACAQRDGRRLPLPGARVARIDAEPDRDDRQEHEQHDDERGGKHGEPPAGRVGGRFPDSRPRAQVPVFGGPASRGTASPSRQPSSRRRGNSAAAASACARAWPGETITIKSRTLRSTNAAALCRSASSSPA
jgi:hypothetical protein